MLKNWIADFGDGLADMVREQRDLWASDTGKDIVILAIYAVAIIAWGNVALFVIGLLEK